MGDFQGQQVNLLEGKSYPQFWGLWFMALGLPVYFQVKWVNLIQKMGESCVMRPYIPNDSHLNGKNDHWPEFSGYVY